jgi:hypothetical protein
MLWLKMHWELFQGIDGRKHLCMHREPAQPAISPGFAPKLLID